MNRIPPIFPTVQKLYSGAVLRTITHAVAMLDSSEFSYEVSWDGDNYNRQDTQGRKGTVSFQDNKVVGMFFDEHSRHNPFHRNVPYDFNAMLSTISTDIRPLAKEVTSRYLIDDLNGIDMPVITAGFWGVGTDITYWESFIDTFQNGGQLIYFECLPDNEAIQQYQSEYELSSKQISVINLILGLRLRQPRSENISVNLNLVLDYDSKRADNKAECINLLNSVKIAVS